MCVLRWSPHAAFRVFMFVRASLHWQQNDMRRHGAFVILAIILVSFNIHIIRKFHWISFANKILEQKQQIRDMKTWTAPQVKQASDPMRPTDKNRCTWINSSEKPIISTATVLLCVRCSTHSYFSTIEKNLENKIKMKLLQSRCVPKCLLASPSTSM